MEKIDEGLKALLEQGKDKGYLTFSQVNDYLPDDAVNPEKLDQLLMLLEDQGIELIDCQQHTRHLASFGAREVPRAAFEKHLAKALAEPTPKRWTYDRAMWTRLGLSPRSATEPSLAS